MNPKRYDSLKTLGNSQYGQTTLARVAAANASPRFVVIKQIYTPYESLDTLTQRFQAVSRHPQLPRLLDSWQTSGGQFFAFEHIAEPPITQLESPPWSPGQVATWLLSLLRVLEYLHSFRLVHGDIRPANIRRVHQPSMLVDLSMRQPGQQRAGGDAVYAAPEQTLGQLVYASDLYSLGLVAIHLLTGLSPFDLYSVADNRWIWPELITDSLPANLHQVLDKLLERSLKKRYTSAAEAIAALKKSPTLSWLDKARGVLPSADSLPRPLRSLVLDRSAPKLTERQSQGALQIVWRSIYQLSIGIVTALALQTEILAIGTRSGRVLIFDLTTGDEVYSLKGRHHRDRITALVFHPQTRSLYSASGDGTVNRWDLTNGELAQTLNLPGWHPTDLAIAPPYLVVGDGAGHITLWELEQLTQRHCFNQHQDWVSGVAASGQRLASISRDRTLRFWSLSEKRLLETTSIGPSQALAIHPSGNYAIVGNDRGQIDVWTVGQPAKPQRLCSDTDRVTALALSPDARLLAVGTDGNALRLYEGASGQCVSDLAQGWGVIAIAFDGQTLVSSSQDETVTVWQKATEDQPI